MFVEPLMPPIRLRSGLVAASSALLAVMLLTPAQADEGGVSFWLPGQYGSFAAVAPEPGFSIPTIDPPPLKWSDLKYVLWHQGGSEHAKEEAHA
jgi:hypothetical protein